MRHRYIAAALTVVLLSGCRHAGEETGAFRWTSELPAGAVVHVRDGSGEITVHRAAAQSATITATRRWRRGRANDIHFTVNQVGNDYYVCAMWRGSGRCGASGYRGRQTGSFLSIFSLFHRGSDASADFAVEIPANVTVDARTTNGSVSVHDVRAGVTARTVNGTVRAMNVSGPLELTTTNGDVQLVADTLGDSDRIKLNTTNGTIRAEMPAALQGRVELRAVNGSVRSDFPLASSNQGPMRRQLTGQLGTSTRPIQLRAVNGSVSLLRRPPATAAPGAP